MKRMFKRILAILGLLVAAGLIFILVVFLELRSEVNKMNPMETTRITDLIYSIKDSLVNVYLIQTASGFIMIDAGNDPEAVKHEMSTLNIDPDEVIAVFLTHSDRDHVASIPIVETAEIYLSRKEEQMINGDRTRLLFQKNKIETGDYHLFDDGLTVNFSDVSIRCILTPGHTPGAASYLINDRYLFTGDALSLQDGKVNEFIKLATMDKATHKKSIGKIRTFQNIEYIFTAHHGMSDDFDFAFSEWESGN